MTDERRNVMAMLAACAAVLALAGCARKEEPAVQSAAAPADAAAGPRLYILDCGTIAPMDPALFSLKKEEIAGDGGFASPCYLVVHPKGTLVWDVGPGAGQGHPGRRHRGRGAGHPEGDAAARPRSSRRSGHPVGGITYVAMSHYHADHTANANAFAGSTWIVQQAEYDMMFKDGEVGIRTPEYLRGAARTPSASRSTTPITTCSATARSS